MVLLEAELEGDHRHVPERVAQRLRFASLGVAEEVADDALVQSQDAREPREEVVEHRPDHDGKEDAEDAFFVERAQRLADGQQQQSGQRQQEQFVVRVVRVFPDYQDVAFINVGVARGVRDSVPVAAQRVEQTRVPGVEQAGFPVRGRDGEIVEDVAEAPFLRVDLPQQVAVAAQQVDNCLLYTSPSPRD